MQWIIQIPALLFSVIVHEFAHGYVAYKKGDDTAYLMGRLTFNPIPHIDPIGSILLPTLAILTNAPVIGWAKPVPINPYNLYNPKKSMIYVALAGPLSNIALSFISAVILTSLKTIGLTKITLFIPLSMLLEYLIIINLILAFFNLFPLYPLDGGQIVINLLPWRLREKYEMIIPYGMYIVIFLVITGIIKFWVIIPTNIVIYFYTIIGLRI